MRSALFSVAGLVYALFYGRQAGGRPDLAAAGVAGMSFHGGMLGVMAAMYLFARRRRIGLGALLDFVAPLVPFGLGLAGWATLSARSCGADLRMPWAMVFPRDPCCSWRGIRPSSTSLRSRVSCSASYLSGFPPGRDRHGRFPACFSSVTA